MLNASIWILIAAGAAMFLVIGGLSMMSHHYTLGNIKSRTVGDGQHGTARWATDKEIRQTYAHVPFKVREWRKGQNLPTEQGLILGCKGQPQELTALVDSDDNLPQSNKAENADMRGAYAVSGRGGIAHEPAVDKPRRRGGKQMKTYGEEDL